MTKVPTKAVNTPMNKLNFLNIFIPLQALAIIGQAIIADKIPIPIIEPAPNKTT